MWSLGAIAAAAAPGVCPPGMLRDGFGVCARWDTPWQVELGGWFAVEGGAVSIGSPHALSFDRSDADPPVPPPVTRLEADGRVTALPSLHTARSWPAGAALPDGGVLVWGGIGADDQPVTTIERLGPAGWVEVPGALPRGAARIHDGKLWVVGTEVARFDPAGSAITAMPPLGTPREAPSLLGLPDGSLLAVGGRRDDDASGQAERLVGTVGRARPKWVAAGELAHPRWGAQLVLTGSGVVAIGGVDADGPVRAVEAWADGRWSTVGELPASIGRVLAVTPGARVWVVGEHGAGWLDLGAGRWEDDVAFEGVAAIRAGGGALVVGVDGGLGFAAPGRAPGSGLPRAYHPHLALGDAAWVVADGVVARLDPLDLQWRREAVEVARGAEVGAVGASVVVFGGSTDQGPSRAVWTRDAEGWRAVDAPAGLAGPAVGAGGRLVFGSGHVYDPATRAFREASRHAELLVPLPGGRVVGGGGGGWFVFDPSTGRLDGLPAPPRPLSQLAAAPLPDGRVLVSGGWDERTYAQSDAWLLDPATGWSPTGRMVHDRWDHALVALPDGAALAVGGAEVAAEVWDPATGRWTATIPLPAPAAHPEAGALPDGRVVVVSDRGWVVLTRGGDRVAERVLPGVPGMPDPDRARWWRLEAAARCAARDPGAPCPELAALDAAPARLPVDAARYPRRWNPVDAHGTPIVRGWTTTCWAGSVEVECEPGMLQKEWDRCAFGELWSDPGRDACWCDGRLTQGPVPCPFGP